MYKPLEVSTIEIGGWEAFRRAVGKPVNRDPGDMDRETRVGSKLVLRGDEHAKAVRGITVWFEIKMQIGFMVEWDTYRIGIDCMSTTSSIHGELAKLEGVRLAEEKQEGLKDKYYARVYRASYQALRRIYLQRRSHRHPDWQIFCDWIETLPQFDKLIVPSVTVEKCKYTWDKNRLVWGTGCGDHAEDIVECFKYCPYCGKEIEICE